MDVFDTHKSQLAQLVNKEFAPATIKRYETTRRHLKKFS